jgi:hypothetical protein
VHFQAILGSDEKEDESASGRLAERLRERGGAVDVRGIMIVERMRFLVLLMEMTHHFIVIVKPRGRVDVMECPRRTLIQISVVLAKGPHSRGVRGERPVPRGLVLALLFFSVARLGGRAARPYRSADGPKPGGGADRRCYEDGGFSVCAHGRAHRRLELQRMQERGEQDATESPPERDRAR